MQVIDVFSVLTAEQVAAAVGVESTWWREAACVSAAATGFDSDGDPGAEARAICGGCPVRIDCVADEVMFPADWILGFRGGLTAPERRRLVAAAAEIVNGRSDRTARVRHLRSQGMTVRDIAATEDASVRTIYRLLADTEHNDHLAADAG